MFSFDITKSCDKKYEYISNVIFSGIYWNNICTVTRKWFQSRFLNVPKMIVYSVVGAQANCVFIKPPIQRKRISPAPLRHAITKQRPMPYSNGITHGNGFVWYIFDSIIDFSHIKSQHQDNSMNMLHCNHCDFTTAISSHLKRHIRIHTGHKPYQCPHCSYASNNPVIF